MRRVLKRETLLRQKIENLMKIYGSILNMKNKSNLFLVKMFATLLVLNMNTLLTFSQKSNFSTFTAEQTYVYEDANIKITFQTNEVEFSKADTLVMKADIKNVSSTCLYFFTKHSVEFLGDESDKDRIFIEFGNRFGSGITYLVDMISLKPHATFQINEKISVQEIISKSSHSFIRLGLGLGYLSNLNEVLELVEKYPKYYLKFKNDDIVIESPLIEMFLKRNEYASLWIKINRE
jgi:hypothetical protein